MDEDGLLTAVPMEVFNPIPTRTYLYSPRAPKHLCPISSTKGLKPGIYASMIGDPKKHFLKFCNSAQQPRGASKYSLNVTLSS